VLALYRLRSLCHGNGKRSGNFKEAATAARTFSAGAGSGLCQDIWSRHCSSAASRSENNRTPVQLDVLQLAGFAQEGCNSKRARQDSNLQPLVPKTRLATGCADSIVSYDNSLRLRQRFASKCEAPHRNARIMSNTERRSVEFRSAA
jgi:hypothetical protein